MKKTFLLLTLALVLGLTGCGTSTSVDNSEVLERLASMEEAMNGGFERLETKVDTLQPTVSQTSAEQSEETQTTAPTEQTETEVVQEQEQATQTATKLQVSAIHCESRISVKLVEGNLFEDCINNPTDLESPTGVHRDLYLLFVGEKIQKVSWIYGASQERTCELSPTTGDDGISYLYFNMEEGNGIYLFEVVTETGKVYSFSVKYYDANVIQFYQNRPQVYSVGGYWFYSNIQPLTQASFIYFL